MVKVGFGRKGIKKDTFQRLLGKAGLEINTLNSCREKSWGEGELEGCFSYWFVTKVLGYSSSVGSIGDIGYVI